jgi:hypothetical protein
MNEPLDEAYFSWLCSQVGEDGTGNPSRTYWGLLRELFRKEFVYLIPNDNNRAQDGKDLRREFANSLRINPDPGWMHMGCSMLELMIGLSRRLSFLHEGEPSELFWELMENLDLEKYNDNAYVPDHRIEYVLDEVIWRTYRRNGRGGLFPLKDRYCSDQRDQELWYQLNAYVLEKD